MIRWARGTEECDFSWDAREGEMVHYIDGEGKPQVMQARGPHYCIKDISHTKDITNDDHQCCCGNTHDEA
jgi:hypothetical protein